MERDNYNLFYQDCVQPLSGPLCVSCLSAPFIGDDIYRSRPRVIDNCTERNTYSDCRGNVKYTLPLDNYYELVRRKKK
jgi:hypothetical protein